MEAPVPESIEEAIRPGGISKVKSVRIKAILQAIADLAADLLSMAILRRGRMSLCRRASRRPRTCRVISRWTGCQMSRWTKLATI